MKRFLSSLLISALALLSPGLEPYAAAAALTRGTPARAGVPVRLTVTPAQSALAPTLKGSPSLTGGVPTLTPSIAPAVVSQVGVPAAVAAAAAVEAAPAAVLHQVAAEIAAQPAAQETILNRAYDHGLETGSTGGVTFAKAGSGSSRSSLKKGSRSKMPDQDVDPDNQDQTGDIDELGNPSRRTDPGPDDVTDEPSRGGGTFLGGFTALAGGLAAVSMGGVANALFVMALLIPSLILHEMGHAKAADLLGDKTARLENRMSFKPKDLLTHIDPIFTVIMPLTLMVTTGMMFGGARPVPVNSWNFKNPIKDMAKVAFAGPAVNFALAVAGGAAMMLLAPTGVAATVLTSFVFFNVFLGLFNLIPIAPLDGSHVLRAVLPSRVSAALDGFYERIGGLQWVVMIGGVLIVGPFLAKVALAVTGLLIGGGALFTGAYSMASAFLPAVAALGILMGQMNSAGPKQLGSAPADAGARADVIVILDNAPRKLARDLHLSNVDLKSPNAVEAYAGTLQALQSELGGAGLEAEVLEQYNVTPIASYRRINAATLQVDAARAEEFKALLRSRGFRVYDNERREIVKPVPLDPETMDPNNRGAVSMAENLQLTKADKLILEGKSRWGEPDMGWFKSLLKRAFGAAAPQPLVGVIDTGVDMSHPLLKRIKAAKDVGASNGKDDNGHGTWVASMILNYVPWLKTLTSYKAFTNGGATLDDILKALTMAGNDGNIIISNSWGSDAGDPKSPDSELVRKLASEGHIMVFAAGNAGPRPNTIGSPAIVQEKSPEGVHRVLSIPATDRSGKIVYFSSRGERSARTKNDPSYPAGPTGPSGPGHNTTAAWPTDQGGADRVDPVTGPEKAISGTSMITPAVAGAIALLAMLVGVTKVGADLDKIVAAVLATARNTGQGAANEGVGHIDVQAAYDRLVPDQATIRRYLDAKSKHDVWTGRIGGGVSSTAWTPEDYEFAAGERDKAAETIAEIEARYPRMDYWSAGVTWRALLRLAGRGPSSPK